MNYQISEEEFDRLGAVRGQIGLVCGLLTATGMHGNLYDTSDLYCFLAAQFDGIKEVLAKATERDELQRTAEELNSVDLMHMIRIAGGDWLHTPQTAEATITRKLTHSAKINESMSWVLEEWTTALAKVADAEREAASPTAPTTAPAPAKSGNKSRARRKKASAGSQ